MIFTHIHIVTFAPTISYATLSVYFTCGITFGDFFFFFYNLHSIARGNIICILVMLFKHYQSKKKMFYLKYKTYVRLVPYHEECLV